MHCYLPNGTLQGEEWGWTRVVISHKGQLYIRGKSQDNQGKSAWEKFGETESFMERQSYEKYRLGVKEFWVDHNDKSLKSSPLLPEPMRLDYGLFHWNFPEMENSGLFCSDFDRLKTSLKYFGGIRWLVAMHQVKICQTWCKWMSPEEAFIFWKAKKQKKSTVSILPYRGRQKGVPILIAESVFPICKIDDLPFSL